VHKIVIEIVIEIGMEQTRYFNVTSSTAQKIDRAQADFFREVGGAYEYLSRARAVHDVITSTSSLLRRS